MDLKRPTLKEFELCTGATSFTEVFKGVPDLLYLGENLTMTLPLGMKVDDASVVNSIGLVTTDSYFSSNAQIQTGNLTGVSLAGIRADESALSAESQLRSAGFRKLDLVTERDRWVIYCEDALAFYFHPTDSNAFTPERSWLARVEFFYGPHFQSMIRPYIQFMTSSAEKF